MDAQIIKDLCRLSAEEKLILGGQKVKKDDYTLSKEFIVNSEKVLGGVSGILAALIAVVKRRV